MKKGFMQVYEGYLKDAKIKLGVKQWIGISLVIGIIILAVLLLASTLFGLPIPLLLSIVIFIVVLDVLLGYPYFVGTKRVNQIEKTLSTALKQMADTLKAGGTYEFALREISISELGPLTEEMRKVLIKLEEGENFENALKTLPENVNSRLVQRTVTIIIDSVRSGAGLADILEQIADDIRESYRLKAERKAKTSMQVMFMIAAGGMVAPFILGLVSSIAALLIESSATVGIVSAQQIAEANIVKNFIGMMIQAYVFIEVLGSSLMIAIMSEGKLTKSIIYLPVLLFIAFIVYFIASFGLEILLKTVV